MAKNKKDEKPSKLKNKKCEADGYKFDSQAERDYYFKCKNEKATGKIIDFELQPKFVLQEKFKHHIHGNIRAIIYISDFRIIPLVGEEYIVDVKGNATSDAKNKRKMFLKKFPQDLIWVVKNKKWGDYGWCEYFKLQKIRRENRKKKALLKSKQDQENG